MKKERLELLLESISKKCDLLLEAQEAIRKEIRQMRDESNARFNETGLLLQGMIDTLSKY